MFRKFKKKRVVYFQTEGNRPIKPFVSGKVEVALWLNPTSDGEIVPVYTISKKGEDGGRTKKFEARDLDDITRAIVQVQQWLATGARLKFKA